ncbi:MAG: ABC-2 family transporter protein [Bdellovibrionales bacterium]|nr:ABC-2 family transporter protein [Bdellovibrionales bacterium]
MVKTIQRYARLWLSLCRNTLAREMEFKINFVGRSVTEVVWVGTQVIFFSTALRFTPNIGNLVGPEVWLFLGSIFVVDGLFMLFLYDNQLGFGRMIRSGLMDFHLLRPVSAVFLANFRQVNIVSLTNFSSGVAISLWALAQLHLDFWHLLVWVVYVALGFVLVGSLSVLVVSTAFWTTQTSNLNWLFFELYRLGWRPETLYDAWLRRLLLCVFPAAFFVSIPVQLAVGKVSGIWFLLPWIPVTLLLLLTRYIWKRGLRRYEGALS